MGISRQRHVEVHRVHPAIMGMAIFLSLLLQTYLPLKIRWTRLVDLPLLMTIYFSLLRRDKIFGIGLGTGLGLIEDALSHHYLGMYGMAKALAGYFAAAAGVRNAAPSPGLRRDRRDRPAASPDRAPPSCRAAR